MANMCGRRCDLNDITSKFEPMRSAHPLEGILNFILKKIRGCIITELVTYPTNVIIVIRPPSPNR